MAFSVILCWKQDRLIRRKKKRKKFVGAGVSPNNRETLRNPSFKKHLLVKSDDAAAFPENLSFDLEPVGLLPVQQVIYWQALISQLWRDRLLVSKITACAGPECIDYIECLSLSTDAKLFQLNKIVRLLKDVCV